MIVTGAYLTKNKIKNLIIKNIENEHDGHNNENSHRVYRCITDCPQTRGPLESLFGPL